MQHLFRHLFLRPSFRLSPQRIGVALIAAALTGCATRGDYVRPQAALPETFRDVDAAASTGTGKTFAELDWWEIYREPQLELLIRRTLDRNRDLKIAAARIAESRANLGVAEYGPLPAISAGAGFTRSRVSSVGSTPLPPNTGPNRRNWRATIDASYEIDFWGRLSSLSDAAFNDLRALEAARETITTTLIGDVATAYFDLVALDQQLKITEQSVATRQEFLDLTQRRLQLGAGTRVDVDRAQANLTAARVPIPDLRRRITLAENLLRVLSGDAPGAVERTKVSVDELPGAPEVPVGLPARLLERRPDVRQAEHGVYAASARLASQKAALFPTFSLTGQFGSDSGLLENFLTAPSRIWSIGPSLLLPILNAQRNRLQVDAAAAREVQAIEQYQKVVEQSLREVADALVGRREFAEARKVQAEQLDALRDVNRVALRRYEAGVANYFEVIDAQRELLTAELALVQAQRNVLISSVQLYKALGGGWAAQR